MIFPFKELPGAASDFLRPVVPVTVEGIPRAPQLCLLDSGSLQNRFAGWVAEAAGIDLGDASTERLAVAGIVTDARQARVPLTVAGLTWVADVWFCDPWPLAFHILGQEGFFRWFTVAFRAAAYEVELLPET